MQIQAIQALRAIAASAVVLVHAQDRSAGLPNSPSLFPNESLQVGHAGVDLFFVLSGFLMTYLHTHHFGVAGAPKKFIVRRLARIVPIYWLLSGAALVLAIALPQLFSSARALDWGWLLGNFLFTPIPHPGGSDAERLLIVGWTLDYEMFFYALFALAMCSKRGLPVLCGGMLALVVLGAIWNPEHPWLQLVTGFMLLEFLAGVAIAYLVRHFQPPRWLAWAALLLGLALLASTVGVVLYRPLKWGLPSALIVLGVVWLRFQCRGRVGRTLVVMGDASYSIYLTQVFSLPALALILRMAGVNVSADVATVVLWAGACALGVLFWWMFESRITEALKRMMAKPPMQTATASPALN